MSRTEERWESADTDPKLIRSYDHPVDGRYLLGADVVTWLRDLAAAAKDGTAIAAAIHAPFLERMAETVERWLTDGCVDEPNCVTGQPTEGWPQ